MKRSPELTPLSHDHHRALFVAMQLKRASDPAIGQKFVDFMADQGERHFQAEEQVLLPGWIADDPNADPAMAIRVQTEHLELRAAARGVRTGDITAPDLQQLGDLLERHVRYEERELFPLIESSLPADSLAALGAELKRAEARPGV